MQHTLDAARTLEGALHELMRVLDSREVDPAALESAAEACDRGFEALRAGVERDGAVRPDFAGTLRTNAIALELTARRLAETRQRLERVRTAQRALQTVRQEAPTGASCDLAG